MSLLLIGAAMISGVLLGLMGFSWLLKKRHGQRMAALEHRSRLLVEQAATGMAFLDSSGKWVHANPSFLSFLGIDRSRLKGRSLVSLVYPDDMPCLPDLSRFKIGGQPFVEELRFAGPEGSIRWARLTLSLIEPQLYLIQIDPIQATKDAEKALQENRRRLELAVTAGGVGIWQYHLGRDELLWDDKMYELYGVTPGGETEGTLAMWSDRVHPDDLPAANEALAKAIDEQGELDIGFRVFRPDGERCFMRAKAVYLPGDGDGMVLGTNWDITAEQAMQASLAREKEQLRVTLSSIADAVIATDHNGIITFMNPIAESLTGWREKEACGQHVDSVLVLSTEERRGPKISPVSVALNGGDVCFLREGSFLLSRDGSRYEIQDSAAPLKDNAGVVTGAVMVFRDVTTRRAMQKKLRYHATHDSLTGLTNRREFENILQLTLDEREKEQGMLCFIDLDRFKVVNDTAGHVAGDALLRECARVIARQIRDGDVLARLGGDEFGLLLRGCPADQAVQIAERLIQALDEMRFAWKDSLYDIGGSVGLVQLDENVATVEEAMSRADVACYAAKHRGRGQVSVYTPDDSEASRRHVELQMAAGLRESLEANRFLLFAQEIRPIANPDCPGHYEILLRLRDRNGDILNPGAFIPAAERYQMMPHIDRWVLTQLLVKLGEQLLAYPKLNLAINLSATSLDDPSFIPFLDELLAATPVPPQRLTFEITETTVVNQLSTASEVLSRLREQGCKVALDDFGSGFSSFNYLKHFPVDFIKIDGSFVRNLMFSSVDHTIVESINEVAHRLGVKTVAEYVEDDALIPVLQKAGVDYVQGYAIGRPQPLDYLLEQLSKPAQPDQPKNRAMASPRSS